MCAERDGLDDIRPATDAAVQNDRCLAVNGVDYPGKQVGRSMGAVELPASMVRDINCARAELDGEHCISRRRDALEDDAQTRPVANPLDRFPGEPRRDQAGMRGLLLLRAAALTQNLLGCSVSPRFASARPKAVPQIAFAARIIRRLGYDGDRKT